MITTNPLWRTLKPTLDGLSTESLEKDMVAIGKGKLLEIKPMKDGYADYVEAAGTTLFVEKQEGQSIQPQDIILGGSVRLIPRTMALKVSISEETLEDVNPKYVDKLLQPSKRLLASGYKTMDIDVSGLISSSTTVVGGYDNVTLASGQHILPTGAYASNYLGTAAGTAATGGMTPSVQAIMQMASAAALMLGPNGLPDSLEIKSIVCPRIQLDLWKAILKSEKLPGGNSNDLNVVRDYALNIIPIKWLDLTSTSQWGVLTDAEDGLMCLEKRKIKTNTWVDNDGMVAHHGCSYRHAIGWANWRKWFQGNV
jgi:hypothetical protein